MSNPGMMNPAMEQQRRQQMALALLQQGMDAQGGQQANPTTPYAGVANAGSDIMNAIGYRNAQAAADPLAKIQSTPAFNHYGGIGRLFGFGGV